MHNKGDQGGKLWACKAGTESELKAALARARELGDHLCFIEAALNRNDCSKELLEWGSRVATANSRKPVRH
jgi:pyruvate decarboxylase